jgi:hypothetical protein
VFDVFEVMCFGWHPTDLTAQKLTCCSDMPLGWCGGAGREWFRAWRVVEHDAGQAQEWDEWRERLDNRHSVEAITLDDLGP